MDFFEDVSDKIFLFFLVFGRFSAKLGPQTPLEQRGSSCSAGCTKNQPRRPILRPLRGVRCPCPLFRTPRRAFRGRIGVREVGQGQPTDETFSKKPWSLPPRPWKGPWSRGRGRGHFSNVKKCVFLIGSRSFPRCLAFWGVGGGGGGGCWWILGRFWCRLGGPLSALKRPQ